MATLRGACANTGRVFTRPTCLSLFAIKLNSILFAIFVCLNFARNRFVAVRLKVTATSDFDNNTSQFQPTHLKG
jgi:hypothetical protein